MKALEKLAKGELEIKSGTMFDGIEVKRIVEFSRTALIEEMRQRVSNMLSQKYEGIERINPKLENMIMYCLSEEYDDSPKSSHLESGNEERK